MLPRVEGLNSFPRQKWVGERLGEDGGVPRTVRVVGHEASGDPAKVIVRMASDLLADMVVVGTHGRKGVERMVMGSGGGVRGAQLRLPRAGGPGQGARRSGPGDRTALPRCVEARASSEGKQLWCEQHREKHGRRHTYYNTRLSSWISQRMTP